jgi:hypothetical protein
MNATGNGTGGGGGALPSGCDDQGEIAERYVLLVHSIKLLRDR